MKIGVYVAPASLPPTVRAYVEYRMFSATSRFGRACERLSINLEDFGDARAAARYRCSAVLDLTKAGRIRASATGDRLYGAIDDAAERLARGGERRLAQHPSEPARPQA